jgi:hypothetical protein
MLASSGRLKVPEIAAWERVSSPRFHYLDFPDSATAAERGGPGAAGRELILVKEGPPRSA